MLLQFLLLYDPSLFLQYSFSQPQTQICQVGLSLFFPDSFAFLFALKVINSPILIIYLKAIVSLQFLFSLKLPHKSHVFCLWYSEHLAEEPYFYCFKSVFCYFFPIFDQIVLPSLLNKNTICIIYFPNRIFQIISIDFQKEGKTSCINKCLNMILSSFTSTERFKLHSRPTLSFSFFFFLR